MHAFRLTALVGCLFMSSLAMAEVRVEGPVEYGIFSSPYQDFQPGEHVLTHSNQTIEPTDVVPAKLGTKFGLRYSLSGKVAKDVPLTLLYLTPGVTTPDGERHDKFVVEQTLLPGTAQDLMAYEFSDNYELVPGEWHFMVFQGDRLLAEKRFTVR